MNKILQKIEYVDAMKGLAILAVIFGHIASPIGGFIFSWHMPLFFFISGFFIKYDVACKDFIIKNFKKLILPFFIFALVGLFATYFRNILIHKENQNLLDSLWGIIYWMDLKHLNHYGFVLWFLPALFWTKMIIFFLLKYIKNKIFILLCLLGLFFGFLYIERPLPFVFDIGVIASLWAYLEYLVFYYREFIFKYKFWFIFPTLILAIFFYYPQLDLSSRFFSSPFYNLFYSLLIIIIIFLVTKKLDGWWSSDVLPFLGRNTMFLFIFHPYTNNISYLIIEKYLNGFWVGKFILSFILLYCLLRLYRRYLNFGIFKYV